jgi:hypothetical protein
MLPQQVQISQGVGSEEKIASHGFWKVQNRDKIRLPVMVFSPNGCGNREIK